MRWFVKISGMTLFLLVIYPDPSETSAIEVTKSSNMSDYYCQFCACFITNDGPFVDCSKKGLFKPPRSINTNTTVLLLHDNNFKTLKYEYFQGLDKLRILNMSKNSIEKIEVGTFVDLISLEVLFLSDHRLLLFHRALKPGIFTGLSALKILDLRRSLSGTLTNTVSLREAMLPLVNLEELYIDGFERLRFDESFHNLTKLTTLIAPDDGSSEFCNMNTLTRYMFEGLIYLRNLTLRNCRIHDIQVDTFWYMSSLSFLDLSNNVNIGFKTFGKFSEGLEHTNLSILYLNSIYPSYRAGTEILRENVRYLRRVKLKELYLEDNGIEYIQYGVFSMFPETLKLISMRRNRLHFTYYMYEVVFNNPNLEVFDAGDQRDAPRSDRKDLKLLAKNDPNFIGKLSGFHSHRTRRSLLGDRSTLMNKVLRNRRSFTPEVHKLSLKKLICSGSLSDAVFLDFINITNELEHYDYSENYVPVLNISDFENLNSLKYLNLSSNNIEYVHSKAFHASGSIEILDLFNNFLGGALSFDVNGDLFKPLENLRHLNLSKNIIFRIGKNVFSGLDKLISLDLSDNYISTLDIELKSTKCLQYLNLRNNQIQSFSTDMMKTLSEHAKTNSLSIDLSYNILACNCETISFIKWLFQTDIVFMNIAEYYCSLNNGSIRHLNHNTSLSLIDFLEEDCTSYLDIIVGSVIGGSFLTAFVLSYVIYVYRWKLRYLYYMAKIRLDRNHEIGHQDHKFDFDIFLSYGDGDRVFVTNCMVESIEVQGGLRLNIRDRDFEIGETIAMNISKAIRTSKRTFLLLSRHFLRNRWCNFEMNMALMESIHTKRDVLVVIFLEDIPANVIPIDLINILKKCPSTDVPKNENLRQPFWRKCLDFCK